MSDLKTKMGSELEDGSYKSCFARSVVVNASYKQTKSENVKEENKEMDKEEKTCVRPLNQEEIAVRMRKTSRSSIEEMRRFSCGSFRRTSLCSTRSTDIPVESMVQQSKINTLEWQLREIEKSREMYRAVMKQVVSFLEKTHQNLELLGTKMNESYSVPRTRSDNRLSAENEKSQEEKIAESFSRTDTLGYSDMSWRKSKKPDVTEEIPPEKLAQEAFRLLRTAQSLLNTREPDLVQLNKNEPENDMEFLSSLAKEFPQKLEPKPQRQTSFSLSPKLILPEGEVKVSNPPTPFNRKFSLQYETQKRRNSLNKTIRPADSARGSFAEPEDFQSLQFNPKEPNKYKEPEKSNSPPAGSISSVEDESGFSSMNSFQDIGLPLVNSTMQEEVSAKSALLRSMLHNSSNSTLTEESTKETRTLNIEDIKLWQTPSGGNAHKRWHSNPVEEANSPGAMKVLWV